MPAVAAARRLATPEAFKLGPQGLVVLRDLTQGEFEALGRRLGAIANGTHWAIGDWLLYGEGCGQPGAKYEKAQALTGLAFQILSKTRSVSLAFPDAARVIGMSWTHHRAALPLPIGERDVVLKRARAEHWTAAALSTFVARRRKGMREGLSVAQISSPPADTRHVGKKGWDTERRPRTTMEMTCPHCGFQWSTRRRLQREVGQ